MLLRPDHLVLKLMVMPEILIGCKFSFVLESLDRRILICSTRF